MAWLIIFAWLYSQEIYFQKSCMKQEFDSSCLFIEMPLMYHSLTHRDFVMLQNI